MPREIPTVLTINAGSSSIKFSWYQWNDTPTATLHGKIEKIGTGNTIFSHQYSSKQTTRNSIPAKTISEAALFLVNWLQQEIGFENIQAVGHRVVHGMKHTQPVYIDDDILEELKKISSFDPDHMPGAITFVETIGKQYPHLKQVACFDTMFHTTMPRIAKIFPVPRRFDEQGLVRYGFHGLSYAYLLEKLITITGSISNKRIILAHLGNGASMAAVKNGTCLDTTMGFTPAGGFMMGTRPGDLDPGIMAFLLQQMDKKELNIMINQESGLLGVSETSADMQELLDKEKGDTRAAEAIALFCYQVKKTLCAFTGVLEGIDEIIFTGGIGENAPVIRSRICDGLQYLGIGIDENRNQQNAQLISTGNSRVSIYVIPTDEEWMIAKFTMGLQNTPVKK